METFYDFFALPENPKSVVGVKIALASSEKIRGWSHGEIKKPETINYRTFKPEREGLFCAKIFGPTKDYECNCGKYKRMKHRGVVCEKCGVEVVQSKIRRDRMGHIDLATSVAHIWFLKSLPSKIGNLLDLTLKNMEKVLYFDNFIVIDPKDSDLSHCQLLTEEKYRDALQKWGHDGFRVGIGAEAVKELLENIKLEELYHELRKDIRATNSVAKRQKLSKRLRIVDAFRRSGVSPAWMIMDVVPVLPPDLRPLVPLEGGRFATSDLNDLYRRVINRNNRLRRLMELNAPDIIVRNEKRMLQESVDVLFDNGRHGRVITGTNKRPLKSLSDTLKGKQGRFRQNLLGKRVDYSGRTVITTGPSLRLHQCGLPKKMALELFKPFVYYRLEQKGLVSTVKSAKKMVERETPEVWETLEEVVREYPVMLNRAPTLHRLGIQSFEPKLIEGKAIRLHPLVCTAFNADFDGDQMAVHVPLSVESQIEARVLMLSSNNILSPANGSPIIVPSQDIVLGIYYMTRDLRGARGDGREFTSVADVRKAFENGELLSHSRISFISKDGKEERRDDMVAGYLLHRFSDTNEVRAAYDAGKMDLHTHVSVRMGGKMVETTVGRVILWEIIPKDSVITVRHIGVKTEETADALFEKIRAGEDMGELARTHSLTPDNEKGGVIGPVRPDALRRLFELTEARTAQIFAIEAAGDCLKIRGTDFWHLFRLECKRPDVPFGVVNKVMDKKALRDLVDRVYRSLGAKATVILSDKLKDLGYAYSTEGGISISIDAMIIPDRKWDILDVAEKQVGEIGRQYSEGLITQGEKYNKIVDIWAKATDDVAVEMMEGMKKTPAVMADESGGKKQVRSRAEGFNPVFMMADSGARGSKDQMRQLAGMRGLMAKPSGEIIETPITANFREGLSVLQYFTSTHGARKGLADTALKTANSGYLTRRLADVAQDCVVSEIDCGTVQGVEVEDLIEGGEVIETLGERILGRIVAEEDILDPYTEDIVARVGEEIDEDIVKKVEASGLTKVRIRSVLTCRTRHGVCARCYGRDLAHGRIVEVGQAVGILSAQSIGEPGTQLTMRTFHIGGTASQRVEQTDIRARADGIIRYVDMNVVMNAGGRFVVMGRHGGQFVIQSEAGREMEKLSVIYGAEILVKDGDQVAAGDLLATWDPFTTPILTEVDGLVKYDDIMIGKTVQEKVDPVTGKSSRTIIEYKGAEVRPTIAIKGADGKVVRLESGAPAKYQLPVEAVVMVEEGDEVKAGDVVARLPRATTKTKDITGGLPRVAELFEVRKPKEPAVLSRIDGYISIGKGTKGKQKVVVTPVNGGDKEEYLIPRGKHINFYEGDYVRAGEPLIAGSAVPQDVLSIKGEVELAKYLVNEVQEVYRLQGVRINDKHIEVIVRQMMRRVKITDVGETDFILEEQVDKVAFEEANAAILRKDGQPAVAEPLILGITKASLSTDSFISAASFQETTKVLTEASIAGTEDHLRGLKENVIMGRLVPAGTGFPPYQKISVKE
ncbi:MAG: DNA-directed RNA polymerase subunit beta' [Desulfococcus sp.]|nr:MAG: DNA-directed RNA polymerase subunit beta' [Desulfococcus sp.]